MTARPHYASTVVSRRMIRTAREANIVVGAIEWKPDGTVRIYDRATAVAVTAREAKDRANAVKAGGVDIKFDLPALAAVGLPV